MEIKESGLLIEGGYGLQRYPGPDPGKENDDDHDQDLLSKGCAAHMVMVL